MSARPTSSPGAADPGVLATPCTTWGGQRDGPSIPAKGTACATRRIWPTPRPAPCLVRSLPKIDSINITNYREMISTPGRRNVGGPVVSRLRSAGLSPAAFGCPSKGRMAGADIMLRPRHPFPSDRLSAAAASTPRWAGAGAAAAISAAVGAEAAERRRGAGVRSDTRRHARPRRASEIDIIGVITAIDLASERITIAYQA